MPRTLILLRHAKAEHDGPSGDASRELTSRGERQARALGPLLAAEVGAAAVADVDPEAARDTTDEIADGDDLAGWHHETEREWDGQSAQDALALLYRLSTQGAR